MVLEGEIYSGILMIKIVADDKIPFLKGALEGVAEMIYLPGSQISKSDLHGADGLVTRTRTCCDRDLLEGTGLTFIASATIGHDHIDAAYCDAAGIMWTNAPGCNSSSVQQYVVSTLLYLACHRGLDLKTMTLGVIGVGHVGKKVKSAGEALGMKVLLNDPPRARKEGMDGFVSLDRLLSEADILSVHVPLNRGGDDNTYHMVNREFIARARKGVILINTSRGPVVDEGALLEGIRSSNLSDVVLDVFEQEPEIHPGLLSALTLATPHIAGYSLDGKANGTAMSVQALSRHFELGLDDWQPGDLPLPEKPELRGDTSQDQEKKMMWEIFRSTYDVSSDDQRLKNAPDRFEQLRGEYPFRREPSAYAVRLSQGNPELFTVLEKLGFSVLEDNCA
jgi:erythronate-4-phosphate dehydrogenase